MTAVFNANTTSIPEKTALETSLGGRHSVAQTTRLLFLDQAFDRDTNERHHCSRHSNPLSKQETGTSEQITCGLGVGKDTEPHLCT